MTVSEVVGTWTGSGETGVGEGAAQLITVDPQFDGWDGTVGPDVVQTYLFVTYSSPVRSVWVSGSYGLLSSNNDSRDPVTGSAVLLHMQGVPPEVEPVVLQLVLPPSEPVRWRAVAVRVTGQPSTVVKVRWQSWSSTKVPEVVAGGQGLVFLGSTGALLQYNDVVMGRPVDYQDVGGDDEGTIAVLSWVSGAVDPVVSGGPWYTAVVSAFVPQPPPPPEPERPPPTDADSFWAPRACCECADVFLINDDVLAERWDQPGSEALVSLTTLLLNYTDSDGTRWSLTDIDGWWTLPPPELPELKRSGYLDGSFPVDGRYNAREITVSGAFLPGDGVSLAVPRQRFLRSLDAVRAGALFVVKEPVWAKQAWVYLSGQPKLSTKTRSQLTIFEFTLRAVDPVKYHAGVEGMQVLEFEDTSVKSMQRGYHRFLNIDETAWDQRSILWGERFRPLSEPALGDMSFSPNPWRRYQEEPAVSGDRLAVNAGTTKVYPRFYIYGPCIDPVLRNNTTGQEMRFTCSIPAGEMLIVDCHWRVVVSREAEFNIPLNPVSDVEGVNRRWYLDFSSQWIGLVPGENVIRVDAASFPEGSRVLMAFRSGWLG